MRVISITCTLALSGSSAYGDATLGNDKTAHWVASRAEGKDWSFRITSATCARAYDEETTKALREAALAAIREKEER